MNRGEIVSWNLNKSLRKKYVLRVFGRKLMQIIN